MAALPTHIGKYRVIAKLGQGGMARVLLVVTGGMAGFQKLLVVKQLREDLSGDPEFLTMFLDEARLAARLSHPNVVTTYEVGNDGDDYFIAMDYLEGQPLNRVIHRAGRAALPLDIYLWILAEALAGLHHAHELADYDGSPLEVVHRDVSPHNIFVTYDGNVKVVDFGIAKAAGAEFLTKTGVLKGKLAYMSPEQAAGDAVDRRSDIFAVGVMMWEALAKRRLVPKGQQDLVVLNNRLNGKEPSIHEAAKDAPEPLLGICSRALAREPSARFASADELREALVDYLETTANRVGSKQVSALMNELFADDRERLAKQIETQLHRADAESTSELLIIDLPAAASSQTSDPASDSQVTLRSEATPTSVKSTARPTSVVRVDEAAANPVAKLALAGAAIAAIVVVGLIAMRPIDPDAASQATPAAGPSVAPDTPSTTAASAAPDTTSADGAVGFAISVEPDDARVLLDGVRVSTNPFKVRVRMDGTMHTVEASKKGYVSEKRVVIFDREQEVVIALKKPASPAGARATARKPPPGKTQPPSQTTAGTDLKTAKPPPSRNIDELDPYK